ncbi:MAG: hypothetical protein ACRD0A_12220 [Acidimicrobiales bacterium]
MTPDAPSIPPSPPAPLTLEASGRRFGHYVWAERRLFEILGAWSGDTSDPAARPVLAANAAHHAWRAEVLATRLPTASGLDVSGWIGPPSADLVTCFSAVEEPGPTATAARLVGVYRVIVPHLAEAFLYHLDRVVEISDRPSIRWLRLVLRDELADWRAGVGLLDGEDEGAVDAHRRRLAQLLAEAGGVSGDRKPVQTTPGDEQWATTSLTTDRKPE